MRVICVAILLCMATCLVAITAGCATPYQPLGRAGGFTEQWRSKTLVVIDVKGNGFTTPRRVAEMAELRAAELALAHNYQAFRIVGDENLSTSTYVPGMETTTGQVGTNGSFIATTTDTGFTAHKPGSRIYVEMLALPDATDPSVHEAVNVVMKLERKYKR